MTIHNAQVDEKVRSTDDIDDLTRHTLDTYDKLRAGLIDTATAKAQAQLAGVVISAVRTQIVYARMRNEIPNVAFLANKKELPVM